jgi:uncharacterized membrane-anchored protein YhcB (DUF1043 family)
MPWIVNGTEISDEAYRELVQRQDLAREQAAELLRRMTDSYRELTQFMQQNPGLVQPAHSNAEQMQQALYQKLRQNLQQADAAPRCRWIKEDGTPCLSPKMRTSDYCFAHMQMSEAKPKKFRLPAAEDANAIQVAIMEVQRMLIDDEISEKKAGLLLYSLQIASTNLKQTTFGKNPEEMVTDCEEEAFTTEARRHGEEQEFTAEARRRGEKVGRSGDLVIGASGDRETARQTPTTEARRRGEEIERSGDLVIGASGDRETAAASA